MPISNYLKDLRTHIGHQLLLVPSITGIIYDEHARILLVQHADTLVWVAPGGSIELNESPADATVREIWEETGLVVEPSRVIGVYGGPEFEVTYRNGDRVTYVMTVFECRVLSGQARADGIETVQTRYFSEAELALAATSGWLRVILPDVFRKPDAACFQPSRWKPPP
jgi:8-oxo-dGTP diphosphatase